MVRSHARNGNEFRTPGHSWLPAKHWDAWFLDSSKSKILLTIHLTPRVLEWHPTCCGIFRVHFERRRTRITANKGILKQIAASVTSQTFCIILIVCVLLTIQVTPRLTLLMARRCPADRCLSAWLNRRRPSCTPMRRLTGKHASCMPSRLTGKRALWLPWPPALLASSPLMVPKPQLNTVFNIKHSSQTF